LTEKLNVVESNLAASSKKQEHIEKNIKKQNLKVFHLLVDDDKHETQTETETKIIDAVNNQLVLSEDENSFDFAYRLPGKSVQRPVLIKCTYMKTRERILSAFRAKRKAGAELTFRVGEDLPEYVMKSRSKLYAFFKECIDQGKNAFFRSDQLVVDGVKYIYDDTTKQPIAVNDNDI